MSELAKACPSEAGAAEMSSTGEERFRLLTASAFEGIGISSRGTVVIVNDQLAKLFGYSREELIGFDILKMVAPQSRDLVIEMVRSEGEGPYELLALRKDGSIFEAEVRAKAIMWEGEPARLTAVRDITERKLAERQIRQSEERFQLAIRGSTDGIWDWDIITNKVFYSDRFRELVGFGADEFPQVFESFQSCLHPDDRERMLKGVGTHLREHTPFDVELRLRTKSGDYRWFRARAQAVWDKKGTATRMAGSITDITDRRAAEDALKRQVLFAGVMTKVLASFATCDAAGADRAVVNGLQAIAEFIGADHAYVCMISADRKSRSATHEWCGGTVTPRAHDYQNVPFGHKPWTEGKMLSGEVLCLNSLADYPAEASGEKDLEEAAISILSVPILGSNKRVTGSVGLHGHARPLKWSDEDVACLKMVGDAIANLLERKRAEESLREISRRLHQAHDEERRRVARELHDSTAQELAAVMMNLEILEDLIPNSNGKISKLLQDSVGLVEQCSQEVRTFAYLLHPPLLDQMGLEGALRSYVEGFARRSGISVALDIAIAGTRFSPEIELTLFRVVQEALGNIHRHSGSREATIRLHREGSEIALEVSDKGKGTPPETIIALERGVLSSGVGLAAMQERLREVGGQLELTDATPGTRLRATVSLPKASE